MKVALIIIISLILIGGAYYFVFRSNTTPGGLISYNSPLCTTYDNKAGHIVNGVCKPININQATINCGGLFNPC